MKSSSLLVGVALAFFMSGPVAHSTDVVIQKEISVGRTLAGYSRVRGANLPASNVIVVLCGSDWKSVLAHTMTDENGYFALEKPAVGKVYYLRLSAPGLDIYEVRVRIEERAARGLTLYMSVAT